MFPEIRTKVLNTLTTYAKSSDTNNFGGRVKYSKINALIDDTDQAITSNITKVRMRRDVSPHSILLQHMKFVLEIRFISKKMDILSNLLDLKYLE